MYFVTHTKRLNLVWPLLPISSALLPAPKASISTSKGV